MARSSRLTALRQSPFSPKGRFHTSPFLIRRQSQIYTVLIILLPLAVVAFIITLTLTGIYLRSPGIISSNLHVGHITGITIQATIIAAVTAGHVRSLWALKATHQWYVESSSSKRKREASTIVGLALIWDNIRCWPITISFLIVGLMTAALVAALTPTIVTVTQQSLDTFYIKHTYLSGGGFCLLVNETSDWFSWEKSDGTSISINTTAAVECELQQVRSVVSRVSYEVMLVDPFIGMYRYSMGGVPVSNTAIGAAYSLSGGGFQETFGVNADDTYVSNAEYLWIRQCFPTVVQNPVRCQAGTNVTISGNNITVTAGNCSVTGHVFGLDPATQGATISGSCTKGHPVGIATDCHGFDERAYTAIGQSDE